MESSKLIFHGEDITHLVDDEVLVRILIDVVKCEITQAIDQNDLEEISIMDVMMLKLTGRGSCSFMNKLEEGKLEGVYCANIEGQDWPKYLHRLDTSFRTFIKTKNSSIVERIRMVPNKISGTVIFVGDEHRAIDISNIEKVYVYATKKLGDSLAVDTMNLFG